MRKEVKSPWASVRPSSHYDATTMLCLIVKTAAEVLCHCADVFVCPSSPGYQERPLEDIWIPSHASTVKSFWTDRQKQVTDDCSFQRSWLKQQRILQPERALKHKPRHENLFVALKHCHLSQRLSHKVHRGRVAVESEFHQLRLVQFEL